MSQISQEIKQILENLFPHPLKGLQMFSKKILEVQ